MSVSFRDGNGIETVVSGLTPGGDLELGVTGQRTGTVTTTAIPAGGTITQAITFAEPFVKEFDYEVIVHATAGFDTGLISNKTVNGFSVQVINQTSAESTCTIDYNAFVLLDADRMNLIETEVNSFDDRIDSKQDKLTFDNMPTAGSNNPVISRGIKTAIDEVAKATNSTCNPNLLDNAWFSVNQRGQTSYTTNGVYCFDRWRHNLETGGEIKTINSNTYTGVIVKSNGEWGNINQRIMPEYINPLIGKKFVLSAIVKSDIDTTIRIRFGYRNSSGVISEGSIIYEANVPANTKMLVESPPTVLPAISQSASGFTYMFYPQRSADATRANVTVYATKLEVSEKGSTLENETAPSRGLEMAKCQRYFYRYSGIGSQAIYIPAQLYSNKLALCMLPIPTTMRANPTLTFSDDITSSSSVFRFAYGGTSTAAMVQLSQATFHSRLPGAIVIQLNIAADAGVDGTKNNGFLRISNGTGYMDLSAEP
jgi:hypothetical protein